MRILTELGPTVEGTIGDHVAMTAPVPNHRAFVRLNMISSADGGTAVEGVSGGLGDNDDHAVFAALRGVADAVLVGIGTAVAEKYQPPKSASLHVYVVSSKPDVSAAPALFASEHVTLVLPEDAGAAPDGVQTLRAGRGQVDLAAVSKQLAGKVVGLEGGPTLGGLMLSLGLVDELFLTVAPRVIVGNSARVAHGPDASPEPWDLLHGFVDEQGFLFLRYSRV